MRNVYLLNDNIITSLGFSAADHLQAMQSGQIGIRAVHDRSLYPATVPLSLIDTALLDDHFRAVLRERKKELPVDAFTRLEKILIVSVHDALKEGGISPSDKRTLPVISTTKGNIDLLEDQYKNRFSHKRLYLWELGKVIGNFFGFVNTPVIVSNACISGVVAIMFAARQLQSERFDQAVVMGGDIVSEFVISGFQSFQALSPSPCKPFDLNRNGLSLGEGGGTIILSAVPPQDGRPVIRVAGAATTNDANHISGPSRTGEELALAINRALAQSGLSPSDISYISAHGTATLFNDEMESKALDLCGLGTIPVNSFKGYLGHTLGAAGIVESVLTAACMRMNLLIPSAGFEESGVPVPISVIRENRHENLRSCLKTASGFGGCNAAIVYHKE